MLYSDTLSIHALSVTETASAKAIQLYPSPASDEIHISAAVPVSVSIRNIAGQLMGEYRETRTIDLRVFPDGLYFFTIRDSEGLLLDVRKVQKLSK